MFIPISTDTSIRRTPWVNYALIAANLAIFIVPTLLRGSPHRPSAIYVALQSWLDLGVLNGAAPQLYQFFTYQFLHANFGHVGGNMLFLWVFGNAVNAKMGHGPYLLFYLAGGVFAATGYCISHSNPLVGASGSIAAVTGAYLALFPRSHITILYWWFFIGTFELPSMIMIVFKLIVWDNIIAPSLSGPSPVAFQAHLAGYAFGLLAMVLLLLIRVLPRDQFDIVALWRRWIQRQGMRAAMSTPEAQARAQYGRVARPVSVDQIRTVDTQDAILDEITEWRGQISAALARNDRDTAAALYEKILDKDPRQVLSRDHQLDVANQLYTLNRLPQAAAAYEKYLSHYPHAPDTIHVRLLLGIIYARDLQQYEMAEGHLLQARDRLVDERRQDQCRHWLRVIAEQLGRPAPGLHP